LRRFGVITPGSSAVARSPPSSSRVAIERRGPSNSPPITALAPHEVRTYDFVLDTCNGGTVNSCFEGYSVVGLFDAAVGLVAGGPDVYRQVQYPVQQPVLVFE
jgi:hypothetical protein